MLSIGHHKYSATIATKQNKKTKKREPLIGGGATTNGSGAGTILTDKDRLQIFGTLAAKLKLEFQNCDDALGERLKIETFFFVFRQTIPHRFQLDSWKTPGVSENLADRIAAMSLNPNVEVLVNGTIRDSHNATVKELKIITRDKCRLLHGVTIASKS